MRRQSSCLGGYSGDESNSSSSGTAVNFDNFLKTKLYNSVSIIFANSCSWRSILDFWAVKPFTHMKFQFQFATKKYHKNFDIYLSHHVVKTFFQMDTAFSELGLANTVGPTSQLQKKKRAVRSLEDRECYKDKDICTFMVTEMVKEICAYFEKFLNQLRNDDAIKEIHFRGMEIENRFVESFTLNVFPIWKFEEGHFPKMGYPKHSSQLFSNVLYFQGTDDKDKNDGTNTGNHNNTYAGLSSSSSFSSSSFSSCSHSSSTSLMSSVPSRVSPDTFVVRNMVLDFDLPPTCSLLAKVKYEANSMDSLVGTSFSQFLFTLGSFINLRLVSEFGLWKFCGKSSMVCCDHTKKYIATNVLKIPSRKFKPDLPWGDIADYSPSHLGKLVSLDEINSHNNKVTILFSGSKGIHIWMKDRFSSLVHFSSSETSPFTKIYGNGLEIQTILSLLLIYVDNLGTGNASSRNHSKDDHLAEWMVINFIISEMKNLDFYKILSNEEKYVKVNHETFEKCGSIKPPKRISNDTTLQNILDNFLTTLYTYDNSKAFVHVDTLAEISSSDKKEANQSQFFCFTFTKIIEQEVVPLVHLITKSDQNLIHENIFGNISITNFILFAILFNPLVTIDTKVNDKKHLIRMPLSPNPNTNINSFIVDIMHIFGETTDLYGNESTPDGDLVYSRFNSLVTNNQFC